MTDETYNGWKNYPTWAVNLWLSNDEGLADEALDLATSAVRNAKFNPLSGKTMERYDTAEALKSWVRDDLTPDLEASFAADLLGYALDLVDWYEVADAWIEQVPALDDEDEGEDA